MVINSNLSALRSSRALSEATSALSRSLARLSSGARLVSPEDDPAGLAVYSIMSAESRRNSAAITNLNNALSYVQTQDAFLTKAQRALDRMGELAVLALDRTKTDSDRENYDLEFQQLEDFIGTVNSATYNGVRLFTPDSVLDFLGSSPDDSGSEDAQVIDTGLNSGTVTLNFEVSSNASTLTIYYPPRTDSGSAIVSQSVLGSASIEVDFGGGVSTEIEIVINEGGGASPTTWDYSGSVTPPFSMPLTTDGNGSSYTLSKLGQTSISASVEDISSAESALTDVKNEIESLAGRRALVGANIARIQSELESLSILNENLTAAYSRIGDVDVAAESTELVRRRLLTQSSTAMVVQANMLPSMALRLLSP